MDGQKRLAKKKRGIRYWLPFYILMLPGAIYLLINNYIPMFGTVIAFKKIDFSKGIFGSPWVGLQNFKFLFATKDAWIITRNTIGYNLVFIVLGIVIAVSIAILLNEIKFVKMKKLYQSLILLPYLMSWVVISYLGYAFMSGESGMFNSVLTSLGMEPVRWYFETKYWPFILVFCYLWKNIGFSMVIYYSSILGLSNEYYEAAKIDGASKWKQITHITLPLLKPTIITMFILNLGQIFRSDFGLFYQMPRNTGALYPVTRTLDVYVYNALMQNSNFSVSAAASFYQSIVGFILVLAANMIVRKISKENTLF